MGQQTGWPISQVNAEFLNKGSEAVAVGDLLYWDSVNNCARSFGTRADGGTAAKQQADLARIFMCVSAVQCLSTDATQRAMRVLVDGIFEFPCDSATFAVGDFVGASYNVNVARNQQVAKVSFQHLAIGRVVKRYASVTTKVKVRLMSRYLLGIQNRFESVGACGQGTGSTAVADADTTLTVDTNPMIRMTPTVNPRKLIMPLETLSAGLTYYVTNLAAATNGIQVMDSTNVTTIITIPATKAGIVWCDGTTWRGIVGA